MSYNLRYLVGIKFNAKGAHKVLVKIQINFERVLR